jgi:hypothetical protein
VAPFELAAAGRELAAQNLTLRFQLRQRLVHQLARHGEIRRQFRRAQRARAFEPAAQDLGGAASGDSGTGRPGGAAIGGSITPPDTRAAPVRASPRAPRNRDRPVVKAVARRAATSASKSASCSKSAGIRLKPQSASCSSSASRMGGQASAAPVRWPRGRARPRLGLLGGQRAAHLHHARAALFQRGIVEIGVRVGIENLVRERRRLGRIDGRGADGRRRESFQQRAQADEIHRLVRQLSMVSFTSG